MDINFLPTIHCHILELIMYCSPSTCNGFKRNSEIQFAIAIPRVFHFECEIFEILWIQRAKYKLKSVNPRRNEI